MLLFHLNVYLEKKSQSIKSFVACWEISSDEPQPFDLLIPNLALSSRDQLLLRVHFCQT